LVYDLHFGELASYKLKCILSDAFALLALGLLLILGCYIYVCAYL